MSVIKENDEESSLEKMAIPDMKKEVSLITLGNHNWERLVAM